MTINKDKQKRSIGRYIKQLREAKHKTQTELAQDLEIDRSAVCQWENGRTKPSTSNLRKLAEHFGVSFEDLSSGGTRVTKAKGGIGDISISELQYENIRRGEAFVNSILGERGRKDE